MKRSCRYEKIKSRLIAPMFVLLCILIYSTVSAHPGRTDANGGHWDRQTNTYHFHTGEYAGKGSTGSYSTKKYPSFKPPYTPPTVNPYRTPKNNSTTNSSKTSTSSASESSSKPSIIGYILAGLLIFYIVSVLCAVFYDIVLSKHCTKYKIQKYNEAIDDFIIFKNRIETLREECTALYNNICMPDLYEIGSDGLPKEKGCDGWGDSFTLYTTRTGTKYHTKYNCCSATMPHHIYKCRHYVYNLLCQKCASSYIIPDFDWYDDVKAYIELRNNQDRLWDKLHKLKNQVDICAEKCNTFLFNFLKIFRKKARSEFEIANKRYIDAIDNFDILKKKYDDLSKKCVKLIAENEQHIETINHLFSAIKNQNNSNNQLSLFDDFLLDE